jgi:hypothetical protein
MGVMGRVEGGAQLDRPRRQGADRGSTAALHRTPVVPDRRRGDGAAGADELAAHRRRERLELLGFVAALVSGLVVFHALGGGALAPPPLEPAGWGEWAAARDPVLAAVALLRLIVLALLWYLVGATAVGVLARLARSVRLVRVADALTIPAVRRIVRSGLGVTLAAGMVASAVTGPSRPHPMPPVHLAAAEDPVTGVLDRHDTAGDDSAGDGTAEVPVSDQPLPLRLFDAPISAGTGGYRAGGADVGIRRDGPRRDVYPTPLELARGAAPAAASPSAGGERPSGAEDPPATRAMSPPAPPAPRHDAAGAAPAARPGSGAEITVAVGDSFWSIAAAVLREAEPGVPTEARIAAYWRTLVAANHDRLVVPGEPDLLHPGQRLRLPAIGGGRRG